MVKVIFNTKGERTIDSMIVDTTIHIRPEEIKEKMTNK